MLKIPRRSRKAQDPHKVWDLVQEVAQEVVENLGVLTSPWAKKILLVAMKRCRCRWTCKWRWKVKWEALEREDFLVLPVVSEGLDFPEVQVVLVELGSPAVEAEFPLLRHRVFRTVKCFQPLQRLSWRSTWD